MDDLDAQPPTMRNGNDGVKILQVMPIRMAKTMMGRMMMALMTMVMQIVPHH